MTFEEKVNKAEKRRQGNWLKRHRTTITRILLFPIWLIVLASRKWESYKWQKNQWDEQKAKRLCDKYLPEQVDVVDTNGETYFYYLDWSLPIRQMRRAEKEFYRKHKLKFNNYLVNVYQIEGFTKTFEAENNLLIFKKGA